MNRQNPRKPVRVAFWTLGCRLNQYDTEGLRSALEDRFAVDVVEWDRPADVYILNSCTVTGKADQECRRLARQAKRRRPRAKVVVVGCYAQNEPETLASVDEIDAVVGTAGRDDVDAWFSAALGAEETIVHAPRFDTKEAFRAPLIAR